jgi:hypothetical protein
MQGAYVPFKRRTVPESRTGCPYLLWINFVPVLTEEVTEDRATVMKGQVIRQQVKVTSEKRLGAMFVVDAVFSDLVNFAKVLFRCFHVVVLVCVSHLSLLRNWTWAASSP